MLTASAKKHGIEIRYETRATDLLFEVSPRDPSVLTVVAVILLAVAMLAAMVPGIRATRVDPMISLRAD